MKIGNNIEMLEIKGANGTLNPVLIWDGDDVVLIDTGLPGQFDLISEAVEHAGLSVDRITKVIITHQDTDHIGCAKLFSERGAEIMAHEAEAPYIQGDKTPVKLAAMESRYAELSENEKAFYERIRENAPKFFVRVDRILKDEEELPICGGIKVIHTPGHTPGHIVLLLQNENIMVTGDAANISDGELTGANPKHTMDMETALKSFDKLKGYNARTYICYHGGVYRN